MNKELNNSIETGKKDQCFACSGCGACCKRVGDIPNFPESLKADGSCSKLTEDGKCSIYENRPLLCKVDDYYEKYLTEFVEKNEWNRKNNISCNRFMEEDGIDESFRIQTDCLYCGAPTVSGTGLCDTCRRDHYD